MPTVPVLDGRGGAPGTLDLSPDVFGETVRVPLLHQSVVRELADRRVGTHDTKGRSEVSGGGRKPWKQKGTGRARQGSTRATQWKGGGKPFGPTPRAYDKRMPTSMRRAALREALGAKISTGDVAVVERVAVDEPRTKVLMGRLRDLGIEPGPTLLVVSELGRSLARAARNIPWLQVETPGHASVYQMLRSNRVVFEKAALLSLQEALSNGIRRSKRASVEPLRCKFGHAHPPERLVAASLNDPQPWGPRPYHCPECHEAKKSGVVPDNWVEYPDRLAAEQAGHESACRLCFPSTRMK